MRLDAGLLRPQAVLHFSVASQSDRRQIRLW
jgi:hypothetical protein